LARRELGRLRPETPAAAADLLARSLAFEPAARPTDAHAFAEELAALLEGGAASRQKRSKRTMWSFAGVVAVMLLFVAAGIVVRVRISPPPGSPPERVLHFTVLCLRAGESALPGRPFFPGPDMVFRSGDRLRFVFESPQNGILYLINESLAAGQAGPAYNVLLRNGLASMTAGRELWTPAGPDDWMEFETNKGVERVWFVWAAEKVRALDRLERFADAEHGGRVDEPEIARQLSAYLAGFGSLAIDVSADPARHRTTLRARGPVLVHHVALAHN
jgi:hypothetical protein